MLNKSILLRLLKWLEAFSYRNADAVTSISDGMINLLEKKGVPSDKLLLVPNWIDVQKAVQAGIAGRFRAAHGIDDAATIIAYAGNIGKKQGVSILVDMAENLASHDNVMVLIIGEGGDLENIKRYANDKNAPCLKFIPFLDADAYADFLCDADLIVIPQKKVPFDVYFPSKLLGIMAKSKPVLIIGDRESELCKVVKENDLGLVADYGDMEEIQHAVQIFLSQKDIVRKYQENARKFVEQYDANLVISDFSKKLATMCEGKKL
jgi:colanic acid biosynthesis glycosyl transferase WcaI